ncbi:hypothetical protein BTIS_0200 [Bifidobacterium tissieri]|uniref:Uncharacterized protein n=1 Tax=Bifidobacterium tissieri TaxID=1630162 RepID=A0A261FIS1_9BIFI|nr:hypothetical protein BTIS_0200 [Bifidobacterium tissieri]
MRASDTHWIGSPTAGSSRMSVGYAVKHALRCGFAIHGCRIEARPLLRVRLTRASNAHRSVSLTAGLSQTCVEYAARSAARCGFASRVRRMGTAACLRCLSDVFVRHLITEQSLGCLSDARMRHMSIGAYVRCLFGAYVRRIRTEAGSRLSPCRHCFDRHGSQREPLPAGLATGSQDQLHTTYQDSHRRTTIHPHQKAKIPIHLLRNPKDHHSPSSGNRRT